MAISTLDLRQTTRAHAEEADDVAAAYESSIRQVTGYFRSKGLSPEESADLAHETILRTLVHLKRHGRRGDTDLGPLVRTISKNLLIERARRRQLHLVPMSEETDAASAELGPDELLEQVERRDAVRRAVAGLSPRHRHAVSLLMQGLTPNEIARELGIKRNAVDAILHRARRNLAAKLDGMGAFALVALIIPRLRAFGRRAAEIVSRVDPSANAAVAATGAASIVVAAVFSFGSPAAPSGDAPSKSDPVTHTNDAPASRPPATEKIEPKAPVTTGPADDASDPLLEADVRNHRFRGGVTPTAPDTGEKEEFGFEIEHVRGPGEDGLDDGDRGVTGPLLDELTGGGSG